MNKYTVSELTKAVKQLIEGSFKDNISVKGEISSFSASPAGHYYFVLKDEKSQIKCVMFKGSVLANRGYTPKNGDSVEAVGEMTVYEAGGSYQLLVKKLDYDSVGLFWKLFEEVKRKLEAEGLFDESTKKPLPYLPKRVALVTSATGAAIKDFLITMKNQGGGFAVEVWSVPVQGKDAIAPIVKALTTAGKMTDRYDVIVLMRGGGSLEDLAVFNEEYVARALYACDVPTVSAIGHERDFSICDFTADVRVATPTAAAALLSAGYAESIKNLENYRKRMSELMLNRLFQQMQTVDMRQAAVIAASPLHRISRDSQKLNFLIKSCGTAVKTSINQKILRLSQIGAILQSVSPVAAIEKRKSRLEYLVGVIKDRTEKNLSTAVQKTEKLTQRTGAKVPAVEKYRNLTDRCLDRLPMIMKGYSQSSRAVLEPLMAKLETLDPAALLSKGYAFVSLDGKAVKSVFDVTLQDELDIRLKDGYINSFVTGRKVSEDKDG